MLNVAIIIGSEDLVPWAQALHNMRARRTAPG